MAAYNPRKQENVELKVNYIMSLRVVWDARDHVFIKKMQANKNLAHSCRSVCMGVKDSAGD